MVRVCYGFDAGERVTDCNITAATASGSTNHVPLPWLVGFPRSSGLFRSPSHLNAFRPGCPSHVISAIDQPSAASVCSTFKLEVGSSRPFGLVAFQGFMPALFRCSGLRRLVLLPSCRHGQPKPYRSLCVPFAVALVASVWLSTACTTVVHGDAIRGRALWLEASPTMISIQILSGCRSAYRVTFAKRWNHMRRAMTCRSPGSFARRSQNISTEISPYFVLEAN